MVERKLLAGQSSSLNNIGVAYNALGEPQKALSYFERALTIVENLGDRKRKAITLNNLGLAFNSLGNNSEALDYFNQAMRIFEDLGVRLRQAATLYNIGTVYDSMGQNNKALDYYHRALPIVQAVGARNEEAAILFNLARAEHALDRPQRARAHVEAALDITESLRNKVVGPEFRSSFLASVQQHYEFYIDLLMQMHKRHLAKDGARTAFKAAEMRRARTLLEGFIEARADIRKGVDPALLERERSLESLLNGKMERRIRLLSGEHTREQAAEVTQEVDKYITEYHELQSRIRANSPQYASLTQPVPLSLEEIQQEVLDQDTLLLEYSLGEKRSYVWAVTNSSLTSFELPSRHTIEAAARRVYDLLTERNRRVKFEDAEERRDRITAADTESLGALRVLSRLVLGPVSQALTKKRLLIVSDRMLQYVPFAALTNPARTTKPGAAQRPLMLDHEVVSLPSASTLAVLRRELSGRKPATRTFAILADPVFERDDPRVVTTNGQTQPQTQPQSQLDARSDTPEPQRASLDAHNKFAASETERSVTELISDETGKIRRLPFTRQEANSIVGLMGRADTLQGLDFDANRGLAMSPEIGQYKYLHFATHAIFNSEHPELSGIVLSLVNKSGGEQDGFLKAYEVYHIKLNADLVVLSSCRTALGKEVRGEGLLSLTRGFMYAGASRVLASLWNVSDEATAQLMINFYQNLLGSRQASPSSAIRAAQIEMWETKRWQSPYYWAGFTLQGEPR